MNYSKTFWMAIKAIASDGFYRPYFYKDNNGNTIKQTEFKGIQTQINSPKQDMFTSLPCEPLTSDFLECHNVGDVSIPKPDK